MWGFLRTADPFRPALLTGICSARMQSRDIMDNFLIREIVGDAMSSDMVSNQDCRLSWNLDHDPTRPDIVTPFRYFVTPLAPELQPCLSDFHHFSHLPVEVQDHVACQADAATAWQLMRTTRSLRYSVERRCWNREGVYYRVYGSWL